MGILVLAVAILPLLGVGGAQVFRAEFPGPLKEAKLTPRIADTAKALYTIYFALVGRLLLRLSLGGYGLGRRVHAHVFDDGAGRFFVARR
jgi:trk system potassium uptake protein